MTRERAGVRMVAALALLLAAPVAHAARAVTPGGTTLTVFAAASLSDAFTELGHAFERAHPGVRVSLSFAGSQQLAAQLAQGAAADVFATADERWMQDAVGHGLVAGAPLPFARNRLAVIVPATDPARIGALGDLARGGVKLVIAADAVPVGRYARQLLANLGREPGMPADFTRRALANVVSEEDNVKGVVGKVRLGEADAGICYRSDVSRALARFVRVLPVPERANVVAEYPIAVLAHAARPDDARAFVELVRSAEGRALLARHGFDAPAAP
jgi:molybdate transport system substrate-binding protein